MKFINFKIYIFFNGYYMYFVMLIKRILFDVKRDIFWKILVE